MSPPKRATRDQWKTLASLSKKLGVRSATVLVAKALSRDEYEVRSAGLTRRDASRVINAAIALQEQREAEGALTP